VDRFSDAQMLSQSWTMREHHMLWWDKMTSPKKEQNEELLDEKQDEELLELLDKKPASDVSIQ
jgi:hypothetical protein